MDERGIFDCSGRVSTDQKDSEKHSSKYQKCGNLSRDQTKQNTEEQNSSTIIISIVENHAREISICKIDTSQLTLIEIYLLTDCHSYNETILTIQDINPHEILLHDGSKNKILSKKIIANNAKDNNPARILFISRQYYDQDRGADMLKKVLVGNVDKDLISKYTVLSGTFCLLRYVENCNGSSFPNHSMRVEFENNCSNRYMSIDRRTATNLELITNSKSGNQKESLFGAINFTKTVIGARLLRSNILRPTTDIATINLRLLTVEDLIRCNRIFNEVVILLKSFPDMDKMLTGLVTGLLLLLLLL